MLKRLITIIIISLWPGFAVAAGINATGAGGAPVSVQACSSGTTKVLAGARSRATWSLIAETGNIRCETGTTDDAAPATAPSATVGFLFTTGGYFTNHVAALGINGAQARLDCCGVTGPTSVDTWEE